jgi:hypothetical protein
MESVLELSSKVTVVVWGQTLLTLALVVAVVPGVLEEIMPERLVALVVLDYHQA